MEATRPSSGLPEPIHEAVNSDLDTEGWGIVAVAVLGVAPDEWLTWQKYVRRRKNRKMDETRFEISEGICVVTRDGAENTWAVESNGITLTVDVSAAT